MDMEQWGLDKKFFVTCITDSASNMNSFGEKIDKWIDAPILRHYYCADHIFQLTAVYAYSGNIPAVLRPDEDQSVTVVIASEKIKRAQLEVNPTCTALKLISDCETRWWSTHSLVEHIIQLKEPLLDVFEKEFRCRERPQTPTALENLALSEDDFLYLADILHLLTPSRMHRRH